MQRIDSQADDDICEIDDFDLAGFVDVAAKFGLTDYGFVVTPNVDHLIRFQDDAQFRSYYRSASYVLMDSRVAARLLKLVQRINLPICTGSDLTAALFAKVIQKTDSIVLIGGSTQQASAIANMYDLTNVHHFNPPMGFIDEPAKVEQCLDFIESHSPFRFCFLAIGSPRQELLAQLLAKRGRARGLALCIGASLNFITGAEKRAPPWMQQLSLEWLYRLTRDPRRLAHRYLVRGPRIARVLMNTRIALRATR